jgi:hypothetical protein
VEAVQPGWRDFIDGQALHNRPRQVDLGGDQVRMWGCLKPHHFFRGK